MEQETKKCPYCGEEILAIAQKCKYCGEWLTEEKAGDNPKQMIPCPICSEMIEEGTAICPHCHENLAAPSNPTIVTNQTTKVNNNDDGKRSFFDYYLWDPFFRHYFDFKSRLNRKHYWLSMFVWAIVLIVLLFVWPVGTIFFLVTIIPLYATAARRLRDADSAPSTFAWISLCAPISIFWTCKPSEDEDIRIDGLKPDTPQPVAFKIIDIITCLVLVVILFLGTIGDSLGDNNNDGNTTEEELLESSGIYEDEEGNKDYKRLSLEFIRNLPDNGELLMQIDDDVDHLVYYKTKEIKGFYCKNLETDESYLLCPEITDGLEIGDIVAGDENIMVCASHLGENMSAEIYLFNLKTQKFELLGNYDFYEIDHAGKTVYTSETVELPRLYTKIMTTRTFDYDGNLINEEETELEMGE